MNRKPMALVAAVALALAGTLLLVGYVRSAEARATEGDELVPVLVVDNDAGAGTKVDDLEVSTKQVPAKVRPANALTDLEAVAGQVTAQDLVAGEQLVASRFVAPTALGRADAPAGLLEVTVALEPHRALGGQLVAGQTVAVVATFDDIVDGGPGTHLILHKITVTSVQVAQAPEPVDDGDDADGETAQVAPTGNLLVTLAVDAAAVERVVLAAEHGHLWLAAEPLDANEAGTRIVSKATAL